MTGGVGGRWNKGYVGIRCRLSAGPYVAVEGMSQDAEMSVASTPVWLRVAAAAAVGEDNAAAKRERTSKLQ